MAETTTPTGGVDQDSSDIRDESLLENDNNDSAVEETQDTDNGDTSQSASTESSNEDESSDEDNSDISAFAKSQGYDPNDLTERETKLLRQLKKQSVKARKEIDAQGAQKLDKEITEISKPKAEDDRLTVIEKRQALAEARETKQRFWDENPSDRQYESKMAEILTQEREERGDAAAAVLASNLPRLLREAKYASGEFDSDAARESGRRAEREDLRRKQEGGADGAHATNSSGGSDTKITKAWLESTYDPNNPEHRKMVDEAMARGELY